MEVVKGVYQIKIPLSGVSSADNSTPIKASKDKLVDVIEQKVVGALALSYVNVYLIEGTKQNVLIDTGWDNPDAFSTLNKALSKISVRLLSPISTPTTMVCPAS